ncbi:hypothetical protein E1264_03300 [Actinomadura sp. KC216]|uniref:condensation domain-containing protein n=1 Tax=Actinomadura sp. KC216 TaxID=2530370 RepID=UPI00104DF83F|nr:condensation domain-containing protein [Actinomadura sp. KC216]TDB91032.1 hypothetical protein E1264_03300 [Actinomadura sp. KC216]
MTTRWSANCQRDDPDSLWNRQLAYWKEALAGLPRQIRLPADRPRPTVPTHNGALIGFDIGAEAHRALDDLARATGVTLFMVFQAGFAALLSRLGAGTDIAIGTPVAGRTDKALDDLAGVFTNSLVLRNDLSGDPTFRELLARTRTTDLAAFAHQDLPFDQLVEALDPAGSTTHHLLPQGGLALNSTPPPDPGLPGLSLAIEPVRPDAAKYELALRLTPRGGAGVTGELEYATDLFDAGTAQGLVDRLLRLLERVAADPDVRLGELE